MLTPEQLQEQIGNPDQPTAHPPPKNGLKASAINTYRSSIRKVWDEQVDAGHNALGWDHIHTKSTKALIKGVQERTKKMRRANYEEKVGAEDSPFQNIGVVDDVQMELFFLGINACPQTTFTSLRNRYAFLSNFTSILRNESQHIAELSDCRCFTIQRRDEDPMLIRMMKVATGKTVKKDGPSQFGRAMRHKDVFKCSLGAEALYLLYRFETKQEFCWTDEDGELQYLNVLDNRVWFDIKLLTEYDSVVPDANKTSISDNTFRNALTAVFKKLGIHASHTCHFGRATGPLHLEFVELPQEMIRLLGKVPLPLCAASFPSLVMTNTFSVDR